jgi:hypothetical protein
MKVLTSAGRCGIMAKRHKGSNNGLYVETKEGERGPLCRNKAVVRSPSLSFNSDLVSEKMLLDRLAGILVDMFLERKRHERKQKESSHILPRLDKGTS